MKNRYYGAHCKIDGEDINFCIIESEDKEEFIKGMLKITRGTINPKIVIDVYEEIRGAQMKVKELIEILEKMDSTLDVQIKTDGICDNEHGIYWKKHFTVELDTVGWDYDNEKAIYEVFIE
jgi:hypothetical protein